VPGQVFYDASRKLILKFPFQFVAADCRAGSRPTREFGRELRTNLAEQATAGDKVP
jgi:hypothetical protein